MRFRLSAAHYPSSLLQRSTLRILRNTALCSLASVNATAIVHINTVFFAFDDLLRCFFLSSPDTAHSRNITVSPRIAATVFDSRQRWGTHLHGLQLFGRCALVTKPALFRAADRVYSQRFPNYLRWLRSLTAPERASITSRYYVFTPTRLKLFDEAVFGDEIFVSVAIVRSPAS